jgi:hypothetical protein
VLPWCVSKAWPVHLYIRLMTITITDNYLVLCLRVGHWQELRNEWLCAISSLSAAGSPPHRIHRWALVLLTVTAVTSRHCCCNTTHGSHLSCILDQHTITVVPQNKQLTPLLWVTCTVRLGLHSQMAQDESYLVGLGLQCTLLWTVFLSQKCTPANVLPSCVLLSCPGVQAGVPAGGAGSQPR